MGLEFHELDVLLTMLSRAEAIVTGPKGQQLQKKVWGELAEKLEKIQPGILKNI